MTYVTIEGEIANGKIVPAEDALLPERGRALITLLPDSEPHTDWAAVEAAIGSLRRPDLNSAEWQREIRSEWSRD